MLVLLFIAQSSLSQIAEKIAALFPASAPVTRPLGFPDEVAEMKRKSQGFYRAQLLTALLGKKTSVYVACGAEEAAVARFGEEHVQIVRGKNEDAAVCMLQADQRGDGEAECPDGAVVWQRRGVSSATRERDYVRVRGHEDVLGGGDKAFALACALAGQ